MFGIVFLVLIRTLTRRGPGPRRRFRLTGMWGGTMSRVLIRCVIAGSNRCRQSLRHPLRGAVFDPRRSVRRRLVFFPLPPFGLHRPQDPQRALGVAHHAARLCDALQRLFGFGGGIVGVAHRDHGLGVGGDRLGGNGGFRRVGRAERGDLGDGGTVAGDHRRRVGRRGRQVLAQCVHQVVVSVAREGRGVHARKGGGGGRFVQVLFLKIFRDSSVVKPGCCRGSSDVDHAQEWPGRHLGQRATRGGRWLRRV